MAKTSTTTTTTLFLRGIPIEAVRSAKAAAALRGTTLGVVVAEALRNVLPTSSAPSHDELAADMAWYAKNRSKLADRYADEYVAIVDGAVADHDPDFSALAERVFAEWGDRPIFMPRVRRDDPPLRFRSPRRRSS